MKFLFLTLVLLYFTAILVFIVFPSYAQIQTNASCTTSTHCVEPCRKRCLLIHKCINDKCTCYPRINICEKKNN
uniref:Potassium channel toxin alpha-KTx 27.4 n=2 Tax=Mesobuthus gibbosus TaxID=123226 RepID=KA274_MESGB|nr:RecName: Full=Potassium channel toxin alpha-KTx 27.4; AltName: Full=Toxin Mgib23; Flags: Precursor [Mesobuthus gibbosus]AHZ63130.1 potassium channel toxin-like alpha-KTx27.4 [Mesobuthus gibbosus]